VFSADGISRYVVVCTFADINFEPLCGSGVTRPRGRTAWIDAPYGRCAGVRVGT
jgi:hypothetical protein